MVLLHGKAKATLIAHGIVIRVRLRHEDLFPTELLEFRVQVSILEHLGGRHPSMFEMTSISDDDLLKLPGIGPSTIRKIHLLTQSGLKSLSAMTGLSDAELLQEHERQSAKLRELHNEFKRRERELKRLLRAIRLELRVRGLSPK
ncbi:hypothetical protein AAII07_59040 [Microvirga sp. 0TCS3.31]